MTAITLVAALLIQAAPQPHEHAPVAAPADTVPLYDNLGDHHFPVTVADARVQAYFDQGLRLYYAFNHQEAIRSFREAQRLDEGCAMCWWGEALAWGPNINLPMDSAAAVAAWNAIRHARAEIDVETPEERALVEALTVRYAADAPADRAALDSAYARAMGGLRRRFPDHVEAPVLHAEAVMNLSPWEYWTKDGRPRPETPDLLASLESVLERRADHPGACHFFIHAVEAAHPERAVPCAERLAALMPGAGHLVHMPGHIYIRVGRYADAIRANEHAVHADETWIQDQRPSMGVYTAGYYPHNYDFLAFAASMAGREEQAIEAAYKVQELIPEEMFGEISFLEHWWARPLQMQVRFARWDEILGEPEPAEGLSHAAALRHYARGRAYAARGDRRAAEAELAALREAARDPRLEGVGMEFNLSRDLLAIAERVLGGHVAELEGDAERAVALLGEAARLEDALVYGEPPEWSIPVRHDLGAMLLRMGRPAEAERAYREDLRRFPENGWALGGLAEALRAQDRTDEARRVEARLRAAWPGVPTGTAGGR